MQPRTLTSFALVPSASFYDRYQPNTSTKIVLITSAGELALQTLHDSPNAEAAWGARGHIGGIGYPLNEQDHHEEAASEHIDPTSTLSQSNPKSIGSKSKSHSHSQTKSDDLEEIRRGRSLGPASYFSLEPVRRNQSQSQEVLSSELRTPGSGIERGRQKVKVTEPTPAASGSNVRLDPIQALVGDDISSIMKRRARRGYSFGNVSITLSSTWASCLTSYVYLRCSSTLHWLATGKMRPRLGISQVYGLGFIVRGFHSFMSTTLIVDFIRYTKLPPYSDASRSGFRLYIPRTLGNMDWFT